MSCPDCRAKDAAIKFFRAELERLTGDLVDADLTINNLMDEVTDLECELEDAQRAIAETKKSTDYED